MRTKRGLGGKANDCAAIPSHLGLNPHGTKLNAVLLSAYNPLLKVSYLPNNV